MRDTRRSHRKAGDSRRPIAAAAPVPQAVAALRRGRRAITAIETELDEILVWVVDPSAQIDFQAVDRLAASSREAGEALACLPDVSDVSHILGLSSDAIF